MDNLAGQVAIVTGGNSGIGKAIAKLFAQKGAKVALFGTNLEKGQKAVDEIRQEGGENVLFFSVDVSNTDAVDQAIKVVTEQLGQIDILVNNAGITRDNLLMKMPEEDWDRVLDVNLKSVYNTCKSVVRAMMKARKGYILNVSSVIGLTGNAGQVNYAASKAGIIGMTKSLAKELASRNIRVNCLAPGFIDTNMTENLSENLKQDILKQIPMGRMGVPNEIAHAALFLVSQGANYITGQVLAIDGGMTM